MATLARLFAPRRMPAAVTPSIPEGVRVYAIGDVHGEAALFVRLLAKIEEDNTARGGAEARIVVLGDVIDRGPQSAVLMRAFASYKSDKLVVLRGNHEAAMVQAYDGVVTAVGPWLRFGGMATLASFGVSYDDIEPENTFKMMRLMRDVIPAEVIDWLRHAPLSYTVGDYFFVHAGVRPGIALASQHMSDLLWIREGFLDSKADHGAVVVHGHTIESGPVQLNGNRIGLDTGAYLNGRLAALGLEGQDQWVIEVTDERATQNPA